MYRNVTISNIDVENVNCIGDSGDTSFILFDSGENTNSLVISYSNIKNSKSNGPFIKFMGNSNEFTFENSIIDSVRAYGPIIENESIKVYIIHITPKLK